MTDGERDWSRCEGMGSEAQVVGREEERSRETSSVTGSNVDSEPEEMQGGKESIALGGLEVIS